MLYPLSYEGGAWYEPGYELTAVRDQRRPRVPSGGQQISDVDRPVVDGIRAPEQSRHGQPSLCSSPLKMAYASRSP